MRRSLVLLLALVAAPTMAEPAVDHAAWNELLRRHVREGLVDYAGLEQERAALDHYLAGLADVKLSTLESRDAQLAFWINAYNACVIQGVLERYPLKSVKQVRGFFDGLRYRVAGRPLTLNEIEQQGRALGDWRIHFAIVCASSSCPPLRGEAYVPEHVEDQLQEQTVAFLADPERGLRVEGSTLWASKIFDWCAADFLPAKALGSLRRPTAETLLAALAPFLADATIRATSGRRLGLKFLPYAWDLNKLATPPQGGTR